jgi:hypothetical protein
MDVRPENLPCSCLAMNGSARIGGEVMMGVLGDDAHVRIQFRKIRELTRLF